MSGASKGRKSKMNRPGAKKNLGQNQNPPFDGAYGNPGLVHVLLSLMGKKCQAKVRNGSVYEGIFHTFNPKMDVALNVVHKCDTQTEHTVSVNGDDSKLTNGCPKEEELIEQMIFPSEKLVSACFEDVDLSFAALEASETNGEAFTQARIATKTGEKKLEPWNGGGDVLGVDPHNLGGLEDSSTDRTNGWDAGEMFRSNEEKFGVKTDYDSSLSNYTMPLEIKETEEDSERVARATKLAQEIESGENYKQRIDVELDDGTTEEDKYSAVSRGDSRDVRRDGRGPRDRDMDHGGYRDKERGPDRANQMSPQGYRNKQDFDRFHLPNRGRGRGREWDKRNQQGYNSGSNTGPSRSMGPGSQSGGRNQPPMSSHMDGPPGSGGQGKTYRNMSSTQSHLPPRFTKSGSGGHSREEERMRQNENNSMHSPYSQPSKNQRQPRMQRSNSGRAAWGPTSPQEYTHQSPTQSHSDSSGQPAGGPLSRTSSTSSNTSAPTQNHRKHHSTSSQEEQAQHSHQQHLNQTSSSPTGGPAVGNNNSQQSIPRSQTMPPSLPGNTSVLPQDTWASIASRNPAGGKPQMGPGMTDMTQTHLSQGSPTGLGNQSPRPKGMTPVSVRANATYTYTPRGGTPPTNHLRGPPAMNQQMSGNMGSPRMLPNTQPIHSMGEHSAHMGQIMARPPHPQQPNMVTTSPQQPGMLPHQMTNMPPQSGARQQQQQQQQNVKNQSSASTEQPKQMEKVEEELKIASKKINDGSTSGGKNRPAGSSITTELREFGKTFRLHGHGDGRNKESLNQMSNTTTQSPANKMQQRQPPNMPQQPSVVMARTQQPYTNPAAQQQQVYQPPQQQQSYATAMGHVEQHAVTHPGGQIPTNMIIQGNMVHHPGTVPQFQHVQQMGLPRLPQQIPRASPGIQQFSQPSQSQQIVHMPPHGGRMVQVPGTPPVHQKPMTSPKGAEMPSYHPNVHVVTGAPVSQVNPPAVNTVSAVPSSPIISYPTTATQNIQTQQDQSPTVAQVEASANDSNVSSVSSPSAANTSLTSPTSALAKALNPEAQEFKPRTPAKPSPVATRVTTPQQQTPMQIAYVQAYQPAITPVVSGMGPQAASQLAPVYNPAQVQQMDPMQAQMPQMYPHPQFPQQFILSQPPQVVQSIHGQQMQQFATFENNGQVYAGPTPPSAMMAQNTRVAAMPATQQYQPDQSPMYVAAQGTNFMQQRPHSANTPTATHVTAASPANPSSHQVQQPSGHPATMVPAHSVQGGPGQVWMVPNNGNYMMVPSSQPPQHLQHPSGMHMNQPPPQPTQYMNPMTAPMPQSAMTNVPAQQKNQQAMQNAHYMAQSAQRSYNQYQSPSTNNQ